MKYRTIQLTTVLGMIVRVLPSEGGQAHQRAVSEARPVRAD